MTRDEHYKRGLALLTEVEKADQSIIGIKLTHNQKVVKLMAAQIHMTAALVKK